MENIKLGSLLAVVGVVSLIIGILLGGLLGPRPYMGGLVHNIQETFDAGIAVNGTEFISNTRALSVTAITNTGASTLTGNLTVAGESNLDNLIYGGDVTSITTSSATYTLTAAQICDSAVISFTPTVEGTTCTVTLPSTTTLAADCLPTAGDTKVVLWENAATTATSTTIAAGTGITLLEPSGGDVIIAQNEWAWIQITNVSDTQFAAIVTSIQDAD